MTVKKCTKCGEEKGIGEFSKRTNSSDGLMYTCKQCWKEYCQKNKERIKRQKAESYERDREKILAQKADYYREKSDDIKIKKRNKYAEDPSSMLAGGLKWRTANPEKIQKLSKDYYEKNKKLINEKGRNYQKNNPEIINALCAKRRAAKLQATPGWANLESIKDIYRQSDFITKSTRVKHHVHHVIPLVSEIVCGLHWEGNLEVVTAEENLRLGNRIWPDMP